MLKVVGEKLHLLSDCATFTAVILFQARILTFYWYVQIHFSNCFFLKMPSSHKIISTVFLKLTAHAQTKEILCNISTISTVIYLVLFVILCCFDVEFMTRNCRQVFVNSSSFLLLRIGLGLVHENYAATIDILAYMECYQLVLVGNNCDQYQQTLHFYASRFVRSSVRRLSVHLLIRYQTYEHDILKTNEPVLMQIGRSDPWVKSMKRSTLWVRRSRVRVTWDWR